MNMKTQTLDKSEGHISKPRNSNLELFRIITMLLIIAHHYVVNSGLAAADGPICADPTSWRSMFLMIFGAFGKTGINCFVLISGYFMCKSEITAKKFCKLLFEVLFYKIVIWLVFLLIRYEPFSLKGLFKAVIPVRTIATGFTSCYLVFFLFIPFINILIRNLSEKQHVKLLLLSSFMYVIIGTIPGFSVTMNYVSWFIVLYFIGSYIRLYDKKLFSNTRFWGWCTLIALLVAIASVMGMTWAANFVSSDGAAGLHQVGKTSYYFVSDSNKVLAVILSLSAFMFFKNVKLKNSKFINTVAASTFGVLLIHANGDTMRKWLWKSVLDNVGMYDSDWLVLHAMGSVIVIFITCAAIDYMRIRFIEKPFFNFWEKHWDKIKEKYIKTEGKVCKVLQIKE